MTFVEIMLGSVGLVILGYFLSRAVSLGWYKSRREFERRKN